MDTIMAKAKVFREIDFQEQGWWPMFYSKLLYQSRSLLNQTCLCLWMFYIYWKPVSPFVQLFTAVVPFFGIHAYSLPLLSCGVPLPSLFTSPPDMVLLAHRKALLLFKWSNGKWSYSSLFFYLPSFYYLYLKAFLFKDSFNPVSCIFYC